MKPVTRRQKKTAVPPQAVTSPTPSEVKPIRITSLKDLQSICDEPLIARINFLQKVYDIPIRRLRPSEDAVIEQILDGAIPPVIKGVKAEDDRQNRLDPAYVAKKAIVDIEARAVALYWAVPILNEAKPGLTTRPEIVAHIQAQFTEQILNTLFTFVRDGGLREAGLVNFTLPNTSTPN